MKKFCEFLREHAIKITNFNKKKMKLLTQEQQELYENVQICYICKRIENKYVKDKNYCEARDHSYCRTEYRDAAHGICNLKYSVPEKIPIALHSGSKYDYHFIIKELAEESEKQALA